MKNSTKFIITIILAVCTMLSASCADGNLPKKGNTISNNTENVDNATPTQPSEQVNILPQSKAFDAVPQAADKWIKNKANAENILMTQKEIKEMNQEMKARTNSIVDLVSYNKTISKSALLEMIYNSSGPALPKYDENGSTITQEKLDNIRNNRNLSAIQENVDVKYAITTQRTDIRALPTNIEFYNSSVKQDHDRMQETELSTGSPVLILHTSADGDFYFIQTYMYSGWAKAENIAIAQSDTDIAYWTNCTELLNISSNAENKVPFIVVTDTQLVVDDAKIIMGTPLPLAEEQASSNGYIVKLPYRDSNGNLYISNKEINVESATIGYAEYTLKNFYIQAFKYLDVPYGWGGMKDGVDCSGYVLNVFKTFGFIFPRNTGDQNKIVGNSKNVIEFSISEKRELLQKAMCPAVIYIPGHTMIYLGNIEGEDYIIHASGAGKVCEEIYDNYSSVTSICLVGKEVA